MPVQKNHAIVFCPENQRLGQELTSDLSKAGYQLHQYQFSNDLAEGSFQENISETRGQVIILLTENYLHTTGCLYRCLPVLESLKEKNRLIVILTNGIIKREDGSKKEVPTRLENVNQMLVYMKYWHSKFLDLRERRKQMSEPDEWVELEMEAIQDISSNISLILKFFKELPYIPLEDFTQNTYEYFFNKLNDPEGHEKLMRILKKEEEVKDDASLIEIITSSSKDILAENKELETANRDAEEKGRSDLKERSEKTNPMELAEQILHELQSEEEEELLIVLDEDDEDDFSEEDEDALLEELFGNDSDEDIPAHRVKNPSRSVPSPKAPPSSAEVLEVAVGLFQAGKEGQAMGFLKGAVDAAPNDPTLRYYYAYALARYAKEIRAAAEELDDLIQHHPTFVEAIFLRGELAEHLKDYSIASACYKKVLELNPDFPGANYRLGLLYMFRSEGKQKKAIKHLEKAIQLDHNNADAHYCLATLYAEYLDDAAQAISHFMVTKELKPRHRFAWYDIAVLYHKMGKGELAFKFYHRAIEINPELQTAHNDRVFAVAKSSQSANSPRPSELIEHQTKTVHPSGTGMEEEAVNQKPKTERLSTMATDAKTVLITGATAGIGKATADLFAKNGYRVIITGRRLERLVEQQRHYQNEFKTDVHLLHFDVRDLEALKATINSLPEQWRNIDILINNAGLSRGLSPIQEGKTEDWDTMIDTNIKGLLYMIRGVAPQMVARRSGHIINVASSAGKEVYPGGNVYCATKFAVDAITKSMRLDLFKHNVRVSQVSPGHVEETEFARVRFDWDEKRAAAVYENFQPLKASDVADAIYYIATRPPHVNVQDIFMFGTQQAGSNFIDRSGR